MRTPHEPDTLAEYDLLSGTDWLDEYDPEEEEFRRAQEIDRAWARIAFEDVG